MSAMALMHLKKNNEVKNIKQIKILLMFETRKFFFWIDKI